MEIFNIYFTKVVLERHIKNYFLSIFADNMNYYYKGVRDNEAEDDIFSGYRIS